MDLITHAAVGAAIGEMMLGKRMGNRALAWGAMFGILPDLDVLLAPVLDTARYLAWHRGPSHSLLVMIAASWFLSPWLAKHWKKDKISRALAGWFVFTIWMTHVLIDCFTVYGTSVLWPLPVARIAFNTLFIIDPLFTLPMLIALVWLAFLRTKKQLTKRRRLNALGLGISTSYLMLAIGMKFVASAGFEADLARRSVNSQRRIETPTPFNILLWRSVVDCGDDYWIGYRSVFENRTTPVRWTIYPKSKAAMSGMEKMREVRTLENFSDGWWIARPHAQGAWLADVRFCEMRRWGDKKTMVDSRFPFSWDILPDARGDRLRTLTSDRRGSSVMLNKMTRRIFGNRADWEANPRLAGVTGSLPEFLAVQE